MEGTPFGHYQLLSLLGRGGMGEVWRAYDTDTDRVVAVKVLSAHLVSDVAFERRFRREARAAAALSEPHVVPIHRYGEIDGRLYVDMRLIEGRDLQTILDDGPLDPSRAVWLIEQVASALQAAHNVGLIHRDVKPSNILVADSDFAYLIDFGIARTADQTGLTNTGSAIGTWAYMSPERFGTGEPDPRSDVYALACVLHQCLTGQRPFAGDNVEQQVAAHMSMPPPEPSAINNGVPHAFDYVIARGMAKNPDARYPTTVELSQAARAAANTPTPQSQRSAPDGRTAVAPTRSATSSGPQPEPGVVSPLALTHPRAPAGGPPAPSPPRTQPISGGDPPKRPLLRKGIVVPAILAVIVLVAGLVLAVTQRGHTASDQPPTAVPALAGPTPPVVLTPLLVSVVAPPVPVPMTDGKVHLAYELLLNNVLSQDVTVASVAVQTGEKTLLSLAGDKLAYWMRVAGDPTPAAKLGPGQIAFVWLDVVVDGNDDVPRDLAHTLVVKTSKPTPPLIPDTVTEGNVAPVTVSTHKPAVISPPLDGPRWLDGNSCCDMTAHRMAMNPLDGQLWAAERFAIDYVQLSPDGTMFSGDESKLASYPYFGADIHAVANGPVVAVLDGLPEQMAGHSPTGLPLDQYGGNHVVQDIGDGNYAFYAHLKTGTVKVKPGDQLTTGQVIANLGNTGNTDAPHLHFHVMSTPDPLKSNGLPFLIKSFTLDGRVATMNGLNPLTAGEAAPMQPGFTSREETNTSPVVLDLMTYASG